MANYFISELVRRLQATGFRDLSGTRIVATVPVSEQLVNEVVAATLPRTISVRDVRVQPLAGDAFSVRITPRIALLPSITLRLEIVEQPALPGSALLVLRLATMGGLLGLAGALPIANMLPPGVRLDGDRIVVDLRVLAAQQGAAELMDHLAALRVNTQEGRVVLHMDIAVR